MLELSQNTLFVWNFYYQCFVLVIFCKQSVVMCASFFSFNNVSIVPYIKVNILNIKFINLKIVLSFLSSPNQCVEYPSILRYWDI